jgi:hypothetical protein
MTARKRTEPRTVEAIEAELKKAREKAEAARQEAKEKAKRYEYLKAEADAAKKAETERHRTHLIATLGGSVVAVNLTRFWNKEVGQPFEKTNPEDAEFRDLITGALLELSRRLDTMTPEQRWQYIEEGGALLAIAPEDRILPTRR